jgi:Ca-activated chloride channel family protein
MQAYDVRVFGFLMGNSGNWPLMRTICAASGGFFAPVSNRDDVIGQVLLAKSKVTHESLTDARLSIHGIDESEVTGTAPGKVYRGQQLVLFGRYRKAGEATVELHATLTGEDRVYRTRFAFPEVDTELPELERLWALARIEEIETSVDAGLLPAGEGDPAVEALGVGYQIVTDQTAMVVMSDAAFEEHGVERRNRDRVAVERQARQVRQAQPVRNRRQDEAQPMFEGRKAPRLGGGAFDPLTGLLLAASAAGLLVRRRQR